MGSLSARHINWLGVADYRRMGHDLIGDIELNCSPHLSFEQLANGDHTVFILNFRAPDAAEHFHLVCQPDVSGLYFQMYDGPGETFGERNPTAMWSIFQSSLDSTGRLSVVANDLVGNIASQLSLSYPAIIDALRIDHNEGLTDLVDDITRQLNTLLEKRA